MYFCARACRVRVESEAHGRVVVVAVLIIRLVPVVQVAQYVHLLFAHLAQLHFVVQIVVYVAPHTCAVIDEVLIGAPVLLADVQVQRVAALRVLDDLAHTDFFRVNDFVFN